jgi:hypothetical protein
MNEIFRTHSEKLTPERLYSSHSITPRSLAIWRTCVAIYCTAIFILSWATTARPGLYIFFLTNLSWLAVTMYFVLTAVFGYLNHRHDDEEVVARKFGPWTRFLVYNLYITQITFQFIVVIIYWYATTLNSRTVLSGILLSNPTPMRWFTNVNVHGAGLVFVLIDFWLNKIPLYYSQWSAPLTAASLYVSYAYVQHFAIGMKSF